MKIPIATQVRLAAAIAIILAIDQPVFSALKDNLLPNDPVIGRIVSFDTPLAYSQDCVRCGGSSNQLEINRELSCFDLLNSLGSYLYKDKFKNVSYVRSNMKFEIVAVDKVASTGLDKLGGSGYDLAFLRDENGLPSTALLNMVIHNKVLPPSSDPNLQKRNERYEEETRFCLNPMAGHIKKLFKHIEEKGKTRILATVFDLDTSTSDVVVQKYLIASLNSISSQYRFANPEMTASSIPGMVGVAMDVDPNALAYLVASQLDLKVWEITGTDPNYLKTLNQADLAGIKKTPIHWRKQH